MSEVETKETQTQSQQDIVREEKEPSQDIKAKSTELEEKIAILEQKTKQMEEEKKQQALKDEQAAEKAAQEKKYSELLDRMHALESQLSVQNNISHSTPPMASANRPTNKHVNISDVFNKFFN